MMGDRGDTGLSNKYFMGRHSPFLRDGAALTVGDLTVG